MESKRKGCDLVQQGDIATGLNTQPTCEAKSRHMTLSTQFSRLPCHDHDAAEKGVGGHLSGVTVGHVRVLDYCSNVTYKVRMYTALPSTYTPTSLSVNLSMKFRSFSLTR